jgi:hypothetical protein
MPENMHFATPILFHNNQELQSIDVKFETKAEYSKKFMFDLDLQSGIIQIEGVLTFHNKKKTPSAFDLTIRSKNLLELHAQKQLSDIYYTYQSLTGIRGTFSLELLP